MSLFKYHRTKSADTSNSSSNDDTINIAKKIVEIARLTELEDFPNDPEEAAKLVATRILIPEPDWKNGNFLNGFDDELDYIVCERLLRRCGLRTVNDPFSELRGYSQVKTSLEFVERRLRKSGWRIRVVSKHHGHDGSVAKTVTRTTKLYLRRTEAAIEAMGHVARLTQKIFIPK